jgi:hypothetical protein
MLRLVFLLLVVIGGLAVSLAVIFGAGLARHAANRQTPSIPPSSTIPTTQTAAPASQPTTQSAGSAKVAAVPAPPPPQPAAPQPPAVEGVPATVLLSAATAEMHGSEIQLERDAVPTIGAWRREQDYLVWRAAVPAKGYYRVEILYSCENGSGGEFLVKAGSSKFVMQTVGTGGWENFNWAIVGTAKFSKSFTVAIKPTDLPIGHALMRVREVRLVPVADPR